MTKEIFWTKEFRFRYANQFVEAYEKATTYFTEFAFDLCSLQIKPGDHSIAFAENLWIKGQYLVIFRWSFDQLNRAYSQLRMSRILFAAKQLFAGHVVSSRPMKTKEKIHRRMIIIMISSYGFVSTVFIRLQSPFRESNPQIVNTTLPHIF